MPAGDCRGIEDTWMGCPAPHGASQLLSTLHIPVLSGHRDTECAHHPPHGCSSDVGKERWAGGAGEPFCAPREHREGPSWRSTDTLHPGWQSSRHTSSAYPLGLHSKWLEGIEPLAHAAITELCRPGSLNPRRLPLILEEAGCPTSRCQQIPWLGSPPTPVCR